MTRIANREASAAVNRKEFFKGSNIFGYWHAHYNGYTANELYIVNSYGNHFPMLVYDSGAGQWFHNTDRYSATTSKHQSQVGRRGEGKSTEYLLHLIRAGGIVNAVDQRLTGQGAPA